MVEVNYDRDALLTDFGRSTLTERYTLPGEDFQGMFARVATAYADDDAHAQRIYDYISRLWFMPATPVLSNGGSQRGLPISCYLNAVNDSMEGIVDIWNENVWLAANGGGIGTYWGGVRSVGEQIKGAGQTSGAIPFIRVMDSLTLAVAQGSLRRGSAAVYSDIHHPEIEEFIGIRKPSGDLNRKSLNLHHGINITDEFMHAVDQGLEFGLRSPKTGKVVKTIDARRLWEQILDTRLQTGEPYLIFQDTANRAMPSYQRNVGLKIRQSNLCSEILLHSGTDHLGKERTAVCCLSSVNAEYFEEWKDDPLFIEDVMRFLDNVLQDFIDRAPPAMKNAAYSAMRERSVGLGLMGFHSMLQKLNVPFESATAKSWNMKLFKHLRRAADAASIALAQERGSCPDAAEAGVVERFAHKMAIAPTASISIICGGTSAGIEPIPANIYTHKTLSGSFAVKNPYLSKLLWAEAAKRYSDGHSMDVRANEWIDDQWSSILEREGSIQHLDYFDQLTKDVYKTAFELDQRWVIELAADRAVSICQAQSVNIFLPGDVDKWDLHMLHWKAWETGVKSLYYLRSKSVQRAAFAGADVGVLPSMVAPSSTDYEECIACQ
jgi:ribonucleoside-diphosphate reductase alpha chain